MLLLGFGLVKACGSGALWLKALLGQAAFAVPETPLTFLFACFFTLPTRIGFWCTV